MNKKLKYSIFVFIFLGLVGGYYLLRGGSSKESKISFSRYLVTRGDLEVTLLSSGDVQPQNRVSIKPPIAGRVEKILVNEGDKIKKGQTLAWMSSSERAALLDVATSKGAKELSEWQELYPPTPILAPIDGTIIQRNMEAGQTFTTADAIVVMSDRLTIKANVDETDIARIKLNQKARIILDAYQNLSLEAQVVHIAFDATTVNNVTTYIVDVAPKVAPAQMRSGMTANVYFILELKKDILLVPTEALTQQGNKTFVKIPGEESKQDSLEKEIQVGVTDGKTTEVVSGINENDEILVPSYIVADKKIKDSNPFLPKPPSTRRGRK